MHGDGAEDRQEDRRTGTRNGAVAVRVLVAQDDDADADEDEREERSDVRQVDHLVERREHRGDARRRRR